MENKRYFSYITMWYVPKNKLHKAAIDYIEKMNRRVIESKEVKSFVDEINQGIEKLNKQYPKCTPLSPNWGFGDEQDYIMTLPCISFKIYKEQ